MERNEVSVHELRVFLTLRSATAWLSSKEIAQQSKVAERTARAHARKLAAMGLCDVAEVFPGHRYRWAEKAAKRNAGYLQRLERAAEIFGQG